MTVDPDLIARMAKAAQTASDQHWAPYSNFKVLAAIETIDGKIYAGSNVENASLTLTVHAEAAAILAALADGARRRCGNAFIRTMYVNCPGGAKNGPCGLCRQSIKEFAADGCMIIGEDAQAGEIACDLLSELLPKAFGPSDLGIS